MPTKLPTQKELEEKAKQVRQKAYAASRRADAISTQIYHTFRVPELLKRVGECRATSVKFPDINEIRVEGFVAIRFLGYKADRYLYDVERLCIKPLGISRHEYSVIKGYAYDNDHNHLTIITLEEYLDLRQKFIQKVCYD